jgi:signal transduction histidine kinase
MLNEGHESMIGFLKKRLILVFLLVIVGANVFSVSVLLGYLHFSILSVCKEHLILDITREFIPNYETGGLEKLSQLHEEDYLHVINAGGDIVGAAKSSQQFHLDVDYAMLRRAIAGETIFMTVHKGDDQYLVSYFPLDGNHAGRVAQPLAVTREYEKSFLRLVLLSIPFMLLFSYGMSRYLVRRALKPAMEACQFQENFLSNVTHELRTPLTSLRGNLEVSLRRERSAGEYKEAIETCLRETDRIIDLLKNLSLLATSKQKLLDLTTEKVDLKPVVKDLLGSYAASLRSKKITVESTGIPDIACSCDGSLIRRAMENVIDNAVKYTPAGGMIRISGSRDTRTMSVKIENTAPHLAKDEMQYLSEPFYRSRDVLETDIRGKGLGLYIARYIIQSHNGEMLLHLSDDHIFSVTISLPV